MTGKRKIILTNTNDYKDLTEFMARLDGEVEAYSIKKAIIDLAMKYVTILPKTTMGTFQIQTISQYQAMKVLRDLGIRAKFNHFAMPQQIFRNMKVSSYVEVYSRFFDPILVKFGPDICLKMFTMDPQFNKIKGTALINDLPEELVNSLKSQYDVVDLRHSVSLIEELTTEGAPNKEP